MSEFKIKLTPTKKQEQLFLRYVGASRYVYNWGLNLLNEKHKQGIKLASISSQEFTEHKKNNIWLYDISDKTLRQSLLDLDNAYTLFFKGIRKHPKFKKKNKSKKVFYTRNDRVKFENNKVRLEKIGWVKYKDNRVIPTNCKYSNTRIKFDGKYWYLTFGILETQENNQIELNNFTLGLDVGIESLVTCSDGSKYSNIIHKKQFKILEKRIKLQHRKLSKKVKGSKNRLKTLSRLQLLYRKLTNIRDTYIHNVSKEIVSKLPNVIVMETLDIQSMAKNKVIAKYLYKSNLRTLMTRIQYKAEYLGIKVVYADRYFPSSQICSNCGAKTGKKHLKIRQWTCPYCGKTHDRDINASINLKNYINN